MKSNIKYIILCLLMAYVVECTSQNHAPSVSDSKREDVQPVDFKQLPSGTYLSEADYWQNEVSRNNSNEMAWLNLYKARRYASFSEHSRAITRENQAVLDDILGKMVVSVPNSFAANYASYLNGSKSEDSFTYLKQAYAIQPYNHEIFDDMICEAVIHNNDFAVLQFSELLSKTDAYNAAEVEYNRNVLNSIEQGGILITYGNVDTYPIILMQQLQNFRKDVSIVCLEWLSNKAYQINVAKMLGIEYSNDFNVNKIFSASMNVPIYFAMTVSPELLTKHATQLYCTGLVMKYSKNQLQNLDVLVYNWESLFSKKYLNEEDGLNKNYLLPILLLKNFYTQNGRVEDASYLQNLAQQISLRFSVEKQIKKHLD